MQAFVVVRHSTVLFQNAIAITRWKSSFALSNNLFWGSKSHCKPNSISRLCCLQKACAFEMSAGMLATFVLEILWGEGWSRTPLVLRKHWNRNLHYCRQGGRDPQIWGKSFFFLKGLLSPAMERCACRSTKTSLPCGEHRSPVGLGLDLFDRWPPNGRTASLSNAKDSHLSCGGSIWRSATNSIGIAKIK